MIYDKPPKTIDEQIDILMSRGLVIESRDELKYYLENISYYHLSIYFKFYQSNDQFRPGTSFRDVLKLYLFDNKLRLLLLSVLERVEKSFKSHLSYDISLETKNPHWFLDKQIFNSVDQYEETRKMLDDELEKNKLEPCIYHYFEKYTDPKYPPIWTLVEILSFGQCVRICRQLKRFYKNRISVTFGEDEKFIMNWMHGLSGLRNVCAHHSRLWNKQLVVPLSIRHRKYSQFFAGRNRCLYGYLIALQIIMLKVNPTASWLDRLKKLIDECNIDVKYMGFPPDWFSKLNEIKNILVVK